MGTIDALRAYFERQFREADGAPLGPVYLPQSLYDAANAEGYDMHGYEPVKPIPLEPSIANLVYHQSRYKGGIISGHFGPSDKPRWPRNHPAKPLRKHISERSCPDDVCMPGLNGNCVGCGGEQ